MGQNPTIGLRWGFRAADTYMPNSSSSLAASRVEAFVRILRLNRNLREKVEALRTVNDVLQRESAERRKAEAERTQSIGRLQKALAEVKTRERWRPAEGPRSPPGDHEGGRRPASFQICRSSSVSWTFGSLPGPVRPRASGALK